MGRKSGEGVVRNWPQLVDLVHPALVLEGSLLLMVPSLLQWSRPEGLETARAAVPTSEKRAGRTSSRQFRALREHA